MSEFILEEANFFIASFLYGMFLLLVYDGIRIVRRTFLHGKLLIAIEDMIFWIFSGFLIFIMMYEKNNGIVRGTALFSMGIGMFLYYYSISYYIVDFGYEMIGKPVKKVHSFLCKGLKNLKKAVKLLIKPKKKAKEEKQNEKRTKRCEKKRRTNT